MKWIDDKCDEQERRKPASQPRRAIVLCNKERPTTNPRMPARLQQEILRPLQLRRSDPRLCNGLIVSAVPLRQEERLVHRRRAVFHASVQRWSRTVLNARPAGACSLRVAVVFVFSISSSSSSSSSSASSSASSSSSSSSSSERWATRPSAASKRSVASAGHLGRILLIANGTPNERTPALYECRHQHSLSLCPIPLLSAAGTAGASAKKPREYCMGLATSVSRYRGELVHSGRVANTAKEKT